MLAGVSFAIQLAAVAANYLLYSIRLREAAKAENRLIDATQGHKTRSIVVTTGNHIILCGVNPETLVQRIKESEG